MYRTPDGNPNAMSMVSFYSGSIESGPSGHHQVGLTLWHRTGSGTFTPVSGVLSHPEGANNVYWYAVISGGTYPAGTLVDYYLELTYLDAKPTYLSPGTPTVTSSTVPSAFFTFQYSADDDTRDMKIDGLSHDWWGTPSVVKNSAVIDRDEWIWTDKVGDQRTDKNPESTDLQELRIYTDQTDMYFLAKFAGNVQEDKVLLAIGLDARCSDSSEAMNYLGAYSGLGFETGYNGTKANAFYPQHQLMVHKVGGEWIIECRDWNTGAWDQWYSPDGAEAAFNGSTLEFKAFRQAPMNKGLQLGGAKELVRIVAATFLNSGVAAWSGGDPTAQLSSGTTDAADSMAIAPFWKDDKDLSLNAWEEDLGNGNISYFAEIRLIGSSKCQVTYPGSSTNYMTAPNSAVNLITLFSATIPSGNPTLSWSLPSAFPATRKAVGWFLEVSETPFTAENTPVSIGAIPFNTTFNSSKILIHH
jgi:hypothetical protein